MKSANEHECWRRPSTIGALGSAEASAAAGDPRALELYTTVLGCNPDNPSALLDLARIHAFGGTWSGALTLATRVPRADPLGADSGVWSKSSVPTSIPMVQKPPCVEPSPP